MQSILTVCVAAAFVLIGAASRAGAESTAELVSTTMIWDGAPQNTAADITRFSSRWFLVCQESPAGYSQEGVLRVLTSADGAAWEAVALIKSPTPGKALSKPLFTSTPDGRLMVSAVGIVPTPNVPEPLPRVGGTVKSMAWFSNDGRTWDGPELIGPEDYPFSRVVWNKDVAFSYAPGCVCGIAQTVQIYASKNGQAFQSQHYQTFSGFFPEDAAIVFDSDQAYCLMSRVGVGNTVWQKALLGAAKAPFTDWEWKDLDTRISPPNLLRLPDKRVLAAVGLFDQKARTSLCEFEPATGKFTELLELPTSGQVVTTGLAMHDGHLWVSYHAPQDGKPSVHLAKVKLK